MSAPTKNDKDPDMPESTLILGLQYFGTPNFKNQRTAGLKKTIISLEKQITDHKLKICEPERFYPEWSSFSEREQLGFKKHWQKEINNFSKQLILAKEELAKRGE